MTIAQADFEQVEIRVGTIVAAEVARGTEKPAYRLTIDFGAPLGTKGSSAQLTVHYAPDDLLGRQVLAVVNFRPKRIAGFKSEVLVLGLPDAGGAVVLVAPDRPVPNGARLF